MKRTDRRTGALGARTAGFLLAGCVLAAAGCGNLTSGGFTEVEVVLSSEEVADLGQEAARGLALAGFVQRPVIEGTLTVQVRSFARRGEGDWEELTDGLQEITVSLDQSEPVEIARRSLADGRYDAVRTDFSRVEAEVVRGLTVGGEPITGTVRVDLGPEGSLTLVERVNLDVSERDGVLVALEMQSGIWLRLVDPEQRRVLRDDFRQVFRVRTGRRP